MNRVEIVSALCRRLRDKAISETDFQMAKGRLHDLLERAYEVGAIEKVRDRTLRLLEVHPLRAASALVATQEDPKRVALVCFDHHLCASLKFTHLREITAIWRNPNPFQSPTTVEEALLTERNPSLCFRYDPLLPLKTDLSPSQRT